ncbi:MAG: hypothetical protein P8127_14695 [Acidobacteriota bacterium]
MRALTILVAVCCAVMSSGCDVLDPARPTVQQDSEVFGNLLDVERSADDPGSWVLRVKVGAPRSVRSADADVGKPTPTVEEGLVATIAVGAVVVVQDQPGEIEAIDPGTEIVVLPVSGTTEMYGSDDLRLEASLVMDFATYRMWRLPKLDSPGTDVADDATRINSSGSETAPFPLDGGSVLYFSARLRRPANPDDGWHGAVRDGLSVPEYGADSRERSDRTELTDDGWSTPATQGESPWIGRATRSSASASWSPLERLDALGPDAQGGVYLTGSSTKIVFVTSRGGGTHSDLYFFDPKTEQGPAPLEPPIFTARSEWSPRTGPHGELLFNRGDRQLLFKDRQIRSLRLPGPHRVPFTQAAIADDGRWVFFCMPRYRSPELDEDIFVAPVSGDFEFGEPVSVDEWRP